MNTEFQSEEGCSKLGRSLKKNCMNRYSPECCEYLSKFHSWSDGQGCWIKPTEGCPKNSYLRRRMPTSTSWYKQLLHPRDRNEKGCLKHKENLT